MDLDYVSIYEDLELSTYLPPRIKELLLYKYLVLIGKNLPITTFRSFSKRFQESTSDSILVNNINTAFFLDFDRLRLVSDSVFLIDSYKNVTTLKSILEKNKDRVIYIDFWASWCLPCLKLLPASKKLSETYKNDSVSVIYLSIDRNYDDWRKSASKNDLLFHDNSFLIVNPATASYLNELKLNEIPRYLLFDKKGNLIYEKAPHPDDEELKTVIKGLL
jgi:thiol-disulfide isomerase/thioredoxin